MADRPIEVEYPTPGIRVELFDESAAVPLRIRTSAAMIGWVPFSSDVLQEESSQVATTIEYRGAVYAITKCEQTPSGWQYDLTAWPAGELARRTVHLTKEFFAGLDQEDREERRLEYRYRGLTVVGFFIAFLPVSIQEHLAEGTDYNLSGWTAINAAVIGLISLGLTALIHVVGPLAQAFGGGIGSFGILKILAPYLVVDSFIRYHNATTEDEALGLLPFELVDRVIRAIREKM